MASPTLSSGASRKRFAHTVASPAGRAWNAHIVVSFGLFSLVITTTEEKEIDHGARDNLFFFAFDYDAVLKSVGGMDDGPRDGYW